MNQPPAASAYGIVAYLDILGYTSFLENNEPEGAAQTVLEILLAAPKTAEEAHLSIFQGADIKEYAQTLLNGLKWLIYSDSILVALPCPKTSGPDEKSLKWTLLLVFLSVLYRHLFDCGLPIRGAVALGSYFIRDQCFAGRTIVDAYKASLSLDLSAIILTEGAIAELTDVIEKSKYKTPRNHFHEYAVPMKDGTTVRKAVVLPSNQIMPPMDVNDLRQTVSESFWRHNKDISADATRKLLNTELFLRYFKMKSPAIFKGKPEQ